MPTPGKSTKLGAKWQLDAALLSRPVDLTALVSLSQTSPGDFFEDETLARMVKLLLNAKDDTRGAAPIPWPAAARGDVSSATVEKHRRSDRDTRLDVLTVLSNLAGDPSAERRERIKGALDGVNEWFDDYLGREEARNDGIGDVEPELHKLMLLLLARLYDYELKTEDLLELVRSDKVLGLETVVGLLEDGETYTTELHRKQAPAAGRMGQWEHRLVCHRHEKPLILQLCRLLRGFTLPQSYFGTGERFECTEHDVLEFTTEMNLLLDITIKSRLVEKLALACHECLFAAPDTGDVAELADDDHRFMPRSIACVHSFLQNMYFYATTRTNDYRQHLLADTLLIPRLVLPYLDRSVQRAGELNARAEAFRAALELGDDEGLDEDEIRRLKARRAAQARRDAGGVLECPPLVAGISASLRTLVIASFRAPPTRFMLELLRRLNPTESLLRASAFVARHEYVFALLCLLNVNMGALDLRGGAEEDIDLRDEDSEAEDSKGEARPARRRAAAHALLHALAAVHETLEPEARKRVLQTVTSSGALPVSRDTPSFAAVMNVLVGGSAEGQRTYGAGGRGDEDPDAEADARDHAAARADAKAEAKGREDSYRAAKRDEGAKPSLLGDLPSFERAPRKEAPSERLTMGLTLNKGAAWMQHRPERAARTGDVPTEFACAINGHLLKEPSRSPHGHVFEKETIVLWLETRGSVCPISGEELRLDDLRDDTELRSRIITWQITRNATTIQTSMAAMHGDEDDLYDF